MYVLLESSVETEFSFLEIIFVCAITAGMTPSEALTISNTNEIIFALRYVMIFTLAMQIKKYLSKAMAVIKRLLDGTVVVNRK
jgi:hypothetical protein